MHVSSCPILKFQIVFIVKLLFKRLANIVHIIIINYNKLLGLNEQEIVSN